ncbi:MAG: YutD-like domain-containing protein [Bacilli bacterium]
MKIIVEGTEYEIIKDDYSIFDETEFKELYTDYFNKFDYIAGDYSYNKLRLKGFYDNKNKNVKPINNIKLLDNYLKEQCAYGCKYFVIKKTHNIVK